MYMLSLPGSTTALFSRIFCILFFSLSISNCFLLSCSLSFSCFSSNRFCSSSCSFNKLFLSSKCIIYLNRNNRHAIRNTRDISRASRLFNCGFISTKQEREREKKRMLRKRRKGSFKLSVALHGLFLEHIIFFSLSLSFAVYNLTEGKRRQSL